MFFTFDKQRTLLICPGENIREKPFMSTVLCSITNNANSSSQVSFSVLQFFDSLGYKTCERPFTSSFLKKTVRNAAEHTHTLQNQA